MPASADPLGGSFLRGPFSSSGAVPVRWDGFYAGAQVGYSNFNTDFGNGTSSLVAYILRNTTVENEMSVSSWTTLPKVVANGSTYGGFAGFNYQMEELVVGVDVGYTRPTSSLRSAASDSIARSVVTSDGYQNNVSVTAEAALKLIDYGTVRGRAGYAFGQFLPYAVLGVAVGRFGYTRSATVTADGTDISGGGGLPYTFGPETRTDNRDNAYAVGAVVGLGMDVALMPNVFLRGEWEYIYFSGISDIRTNLNTGRVGIAVRF